MTTAIRERRRSPEGGRCGRRSGLYKAILIALPAFPVLFALPKARAECDSPNVVNGPWNASQGTLPACTELVGWYGMSTTDEALFYNTSSTVLVASGDNTYDDKGYSDMPAGVYAGATIDNTTREIILHGSQTIQQTPEGPHSAVPHWAGMFAAGSDSTRIARVTVASDADVKVNYGGGTEAKGMYALGEGAVLKVDGNVGIDFSSTDESLYGVHLNDGGSLIGSGKISVASTANSFFHGLGIAVGTGGSVNFSGAVHLKTTSNGLEITAGAGDVVVDGPDARAEWSTISSNGSGTSNLGYVAAVAFESGGQFTLKNARIEATGSDTIGFNLYAEGNAILDEVEIQVDSQPVIGTAGIDHSKGNLKASGLVINTSQDGVHGLWVDNTTTSGNFTIKFCGTNGGSGTDCGPDGDSRVNSMTTQGEGAHGVSMENINRTVELSNTTVTTHGEKAFGLNLTAGNFVSNAGVSFSTNETGADAIVWAPSGSASLTLDPTTKVATAGLNAHGFVTDGADLTVGASGTFLPIDQFDVSGQGSAVVAARNGSTLTLEGVSLGDAAIGTLSWGAKAEANSTIRFGTNAQAGGAPVWAVDTATLDFNEDTSSASGSLARIDQGGTLDLSGRSSGLTLGLLGDDGTSGGSVLLGGNDITLDGDGTSTFRGTIQGAGGLVMNGSGRQVLFGNSAFGYGGATTIESGTLAFAGGIDATGKTVGFSGGTLDISGNGGALDIDGIEGTGGTVALGNSGGPVSDLVFVGAGTYAYEGAIQGDGNLSMRGSGVQTLSGADVFGYSGSTTIETGTLSVAGADTQAGGRAFEIQSGGTLDISAVTATPIPGHVGFLLGSIEDGGTVTLGDKDLVLDGTGAAAFTGTIEGAGGLVMAGSGTQTLSGSGALAYGGATTIMSGTLALAGGVDGTGTTVDFTGGTLDIHDNDGTFDIGGIQGTGGTVALGTRGNGISDLVFVGDGTYAYEGAILGDGNLVKRGGGTQTLSGNGAFGYSGGTRVEAGTLAVAGDTSASGRVFNVQSNGMLDVSSVTAAPLDGYTGLRAGAILGDGLVQLGTNSLVLDGAAPATFSGTIQGDDASSYVVKTGSATLTLSGERAYDYAGTVIQKGVLKIRDISDPAQFAHEVTLDGGWLDLSDNAFVYDPDGTGADQWVALNVQDGANAASGGIIGGDDVLAYDVASGTRTEVAQLGGDGSDPGQQGLYLLKTGAGTLELTGVNHYVGNTRVQDGTLKISRDENLGSTSVHREVALDGGSLEIAGSFESLRHIDLRQDGSVVVDEGFDTTWYGADGATRTLTKEGEGRLAFHGASTLGGVLANGGVLDLGTATVDATKTATPIGPAVTLQHGATVDFLHGSATSAGHAIVAEGDSTLNLRDHTSVTAGDGHALYRVTGGTGVVNANAQTLAGMLAAHGQNSRLQLTLSNGSTYTGVPALSGGGTAGLTLADAGSTWNLTGDATLDSLVNAGRIVFGGASSSSSSATAAVDGGYRTIHVTGDYASNGGTLVLRTELNAGGALSDQNTDRLLVEGDISGQTLLDLQVSGTGANTNTSGNDQAVPSEGISLVQVGRSVAADAFKLKRDYVAIAGSPYQYRLFAYGTGDYPAPDPSQNLLTTGSAVVDYRLQTSCVDSSGSIRPGTCSNPSPGPGPRPTPVPQVSSYLTVPLALQNYGAMVMDSLNRRLGDVRRDPFDEPGDTAEAFARAINSRNDYTTNLDWNQYGYDFDQNISAVQVGGNWVRTMDDDQDIRLGAAATLGSTKVEPATIPEEYSRASVDAQSLALTATWQNRDGWYLDGVAMAEHYDGKIRTAHRGDAGDVDADGWSLSLEAGRTITLANGVRIEPQLQALGQSLRFSDQVDADHIHVKTGHLRAWTARLGVRVAMPVAATTSWMPYARVRLQHTWMNKPKVVLSDQVFDIGKPGGAVQYGIGVSGMVTQRLSLYGEVGGQRRDGDHGFSNFNVTIGGRYAF